MAYLYKLVDCTIDAKRTKIVGVRQLLSISTLESEVPNWRFPEGNISWTVKKMKTKRKPGKPAKKKRKEDS